MATPSKANFKIKANGHWTQVWQISNADTPLDLAGYDFELEIKKTKGFRATKFLNLKVGSGLTIVDSSTGKIQVDIEPQTSVVQTQVFFYDLIAIKDGKPFVWLEGEMTFEPGVSYLGD